MCTHTYAHMYTKYNVKTRLGKPLGCTASFTIRFCVFYVGLATPAAKVCLTIPGVAPGQGHCHWVTKLPVWVN